MTAFLRGVVSHVADRSSAREQPSFHVYETDAQPHPGAVEEQRAIYGVLPEMTDDGQARRTPLRETFPLVGWVKHADHLAWIRANGKYNFRMGSTPGALRLSAQGVGVCYLLLHGEGEQAVPGLFKIKDPTAGPQVYAAADLSALGYPTTPSQPSYLVYDIEPAAEFSAYIWDYTAMENKPAMAAKGHPYAVPLMAVLRVGRPEGDGSAT